MLIRVQATKLNSSGAASPKPELGYCKDTELSIKFRVGAGATAILEGNFGSRSLPRYQRFCQIYWKL